MEQNQPIFQEEARLAPVRIDLGKRLGAYVLDGIFISIGGVIIGLIAGATLSAYFFDDINVQYGQDDIGGLIIGVIGGMLGVIAGILLTAALNILLEALTGQSIGKMMLGIINRNEDGSIANAMTLMLRAAIKYISTFMFVLFIMTEEVVLIGIGQIAGFVVFIGFFFILGDKKQGFHDMISKTAVFNKSDLR